MKDEFVGKHGEGEPTKPTLAMETSRGSADWLDFPLSKHWLRNLADTA